MGVNNQLLVGGACVATIALVLARSGKPTETPGWDARAPTLSEARVDGSGRLIASLEDLESHWTSITGDITGSPESQAVEKTWTDLMKLRGRGEELFGEEPRTVGWAEFEERASTLATKIQHQKGLLTTPTKEVRRVPVNAARPPPVARPALVIEEDSPSFAADSAGDDRDLPSGSRTISEAQDSMLDHFAREAVSAVTTADRSDSAFQSIANAPDVPELRPDGVETLSNQQASAGYEKAQNDPVRRLVKELTTDDIGGSSMVAASEPPSLPDTPVAAPTKVPKPAVTHRERLTLVQNEAAKRAAGGSDPSFDQGGERLDPAKTAQAVRTKIDVHFGIVTKNTAFIKENRSDSGNSGRLAAIASAIGNLSKLRSEAAAAGQDKYWDLIYRRAAVLQTEAGGRPAKRQAAPRVTQVQGDPKRARTETPAQAQARALSERSVTGQPPAKKLRRASLVPITVKPEAPTAPSMPEEEPSLM